MNKIPFLLFQTATMTLEEFLGILRKAVAKQFAEREDLAMVSAT